MAILGIILYKWKDMLTILKEKKEEYVYNFQTNQEV